MVRFAAEIKVGITGKDNSNDREIDHKVEGDSFKDFSEYLTKTIEYYRSMVKFETMTEFVSIKIFVYGEFNSRIWISMDSDETVSVKELWD